MCLNKELSIEESPLYIENSQTLTIVRNIVNPYSLVKRQFNTMLRDSMKELPYFRFYVTEHLVDDISFQSLAVKGLFIDVCAFYWFKDCSITRAMLEQKFSNAIGELEILINTGILKSSKVKNGEVLLDTISIKFLDEQFKTLDKNHSKRVEAGSKGGSKKASNARAGLQQNPSYKDKIDNDKDIDIDNKNVNHNSKYSERFENLWLAGHRPTDSKADCFDKYKKIIKSNTFDSNFLMDRWIAYIKFTKVEDPELKYIKGFVPWLNKKGWDAEYKIQSTYKPEKKLSGEIEADRIANLPKKERDEYHEKAEAEFKKIKEKFGVRE